MPMKMIKRKIKKTGYRKKLNQTQKYEVKRMVDARLETKAVDFISAIGSQYGILGTFTDVTSISQGASSITRVGDQIMPLKLQCRLYFQQQTTLTDSLTRFVVFQWRPDNATAPVLADIFDPGPGSLVTPFSPYNYDNRQLYRILKDVTFKMVGSLGNVDNTKSMVFEVPLHKVSKVNYDIGVSTGDHHIYTLIFGSNTAGVNNNLVTYDTRILYKDA